MEATAVQRMHSEQSLDFASTLAIETEPDTESAKTTESSSESPSPSQSPMKSPQKSESSMENGMISASALLQQRLQSIQNKQAEYAKMFTDFNVIVDQLQNKLHIETKRKEERHQKQLLEGTAHPRPEYPKLIVDDDDCMVVLGPNGTEVPTRSFYSVNWSSGAAATRSLLTLVFSAEVLSTHTLTGKPSPAFHGRERPPKMQLDPLKVADIIHCVLVKCSCNEREIRSAITTKCADTTKKFKRRILKQQPMLLLPPQLQPEVQLQSEALSRTLLQSQLEQKQLTQLQLQAQAQLEIFRSKKLQQQQYPLHPQQEPQAQQHIQTANQPEWQKYVLQKELEIKKQQIEEKIDRINKKYILRQQEEEQRIQQQKHHELVQQKALKKQQQQLQTKQQYDVLLLQQQQQEHEQLFLQRQQQQQQIQLQQQQQQIQLQQQVKEQLRITQQQCQQQQWQQLQQLKQQQPQAEWQQIKLQPQQVDHYPQLYQNIKQMGQQPQQHPQQQKLLIGELMQQQHPQQQKLLIDELMQQQQQQQFNSVQKLFKIEPQTAPTNSPQITQEQDNRIDSQHSQLFSPMNLQNTITTASDVFALSLQHQYSKLLLQIQQQEKYVFKAPLHK